MGGGGRGRRGGLGLRRWLREQAGHRQGSVESMLQGPRTPLTRPSSRVKLNFSWAKCFSCCRNCKYSGLSGSLYVMILAA